MQNLIADLKNKDKRKVLLSKAKRRILKHVWLVRLGAVGALVIVVYLLFSGVTLVFRNTPLGFYAGLAYDFTFTPSGKIDSFGGRTNILILGKGGGVHEAPDLTDTIIFASISHRTKDIALVSLPRDIWVPAIRAKVNSAYYWGNKKQEGGGLLLARSVVEEVVGQPVHYAAVLDFDGFLKVIDILGGVDVEVETAFVDTKYPITGKENDLCNGDKTYACRYETIRFDKGLIHMDGSAALKFVRSRNAEGVEGTDLARAARQEKVLGALKEKIVSKQVLVSPSTLRSLLETLDETVERDMDMSTAVIVARRLVEARGNLRTYVIPENFLVNPPISPKYDNLYVFIPDGDSWEIVHNWIACILVGTDCVNDPN